MRYIGDLLGSGESVLIYPEGRRDPQGAVGEFRPGIGMIGARLAVPIVPVRITGLDRVLPVGASWPTRGPVTVSFGAPLVLRGDDYAALARLVEEAVRRLGPQG
jgi:long-chain acyl-CoA synthetase